MVQVCLWSLYEAPLLQCRLLHQPQEEIQESHKDCFVSEVSELPLLVVLIVSVVFGRVNVPFAENVEPMCVWFIGVTPEVDGSR